MSFILLVSLDISIFMNLVRWPSLSLKADSKKCIDCILCNEVCPMSLDVNGMVKSANMENSECILCGSCVDSCRKGVIDYSFGR